jgi:hypothetical protein
MVMPAATEPLPETVLPADWVAAAETAPAPVTVAVPLVVEPAATSC